MGRYIEQGLMPPDSIATIDLSGSSMKMANGARDVFLTDDVASSSVRESISAGTPAVEQSDAQLSAQTTDKARPLISILIPAHNAEQWIATAIRSALAQTWNPKEIIVVDDGSSDRTLEVARQYASDTVRVITQPNQGASAARNCAFSACRGDYIQWLDADDILAPDKVALQMAVVEDGAGGRTLLSSEWGKFMYRSSRAHFAPSALWEDLSPVEWLLRKLGRNLYMQTATWLVSRELTVAAGPWDTRLMGDDDGEYFCRILLASNGVRFVPGSKVYYRCFGYTGLNYLGSSPEKLTAHWTSMRLHMKYLQSLEQSDRVNAACLEYLRTSLIYFYPERQDILAVAESMASEFGDQLGAPSLSWKYSWIRRVVGWRLVKAYQRIARRTRWRVQARFAGLLFHVRGRRFRESDLNPEIEFQLAKKPTAASDLCNDPLVEHGGNSTKAG
jgi:glycosyltransferase involved in cell wall biosynthesis